MATPQVWNGTTWAALTKAKTRYYNGSTWVEPSDIKYWTGSTWASIFSSAGLVALRASASSQQNAAGSIDVTVPASTQPGDLLVIAVAQTMNATTVFNTVSGWTKQGEQRAGAAAHTLAIYTRIAQVGDASSVVTVTSTQTENIAIQLRVFSGVNQTTPLDTPVAFAEVATAGASGSAPAVTVATAGAMIMTVYTVPTTSSTTLSAADWTDPSGFSSELVNCTTNTTNNAAVATYVKSAPSAGADGPFATTITQSRRWALATIAIRPA